MRKVVFGGVLGFFILFMLKKEANAACHAEIGCNAPEGSDPTGEWTPSYDKCMKCYCGMHKEEITTCTEFFYSKSVKKSSFTTFIEEEVEVEVQEGEEVDCGDGTISLEIDEGTGEPIVPTGIRYVRYYTNQMRSFCCSTTVSFWNVPPQCEEVEVDECTKAIVRKDNPEEPCDLPMYMTG